MPRLKAAIDIDAPREHVFALAGDITKQPEWTTFIKEVVVTAGDGKSQGSAAKRKIKVGPVHNDLEDTIVEYEANEALGRRFIGTFEGDDRLTFTPEGTGTRVEWRVNYTPPFGIIGKIGALLVMERVFQNELEASLDTLKAQLEI
jgi:uncharacterized membrane protein